jgi:hypothetical protein
MHTNKRFSTTLRVGVAVFFILSLADYLLTWRLVSAAHSEVDEINPIASWILEQSGWIGLACFKATLVTGICMAVLTIAARRQALGAAVIMFGCGAQASVVITGAMLFHATKPPEHICLVDLPSAANDSNPTLPPGGFVLLSFKPIQYELGLSASVIYDVSDIARRRAELRQKMRTENLTDGHDFFLELYGRERLLAESLSQRQAKRLRQIAWQIRGELSLADQEVMEALGFTDVQMNAVGAIMGETKAENISLVVPRKSAVPAITGTGDLAGAKVRLSRVLNAAQKSRWHELQGERFDFQAAPQVVTVLTLPTAE